MPKPHSLVINTVQALKHDPYAETVTIASIDPESLDNTINDIYKRLDAPGEAVKASLQGGENAVIFVIAGTQSVPIPFKRGDSLEAVFSQLRLLLG